MSSTTKTPPEGGEKKKSSKLERIFELQADRKRLKEENKSLRRQLDASKKGRSPPRKSPGRPGDEEKLLAAMSALKRVTVNQERNLCSLRSKAEERRRELAEKDAKIASLTKEVAKLKRSHKARKAASTDDIDVVRSKMEDMQLSSSELENRNVELANKLEESEERVKSLEKQLDSARGLLKGAPSAKSILSTGDLSTSEMDIAKLRKDLASKIERIVLLEFDLEMCKDELHELRQTRSSVASYPAPDAQNYGATDFDGNYFSDLSDDDDEEEEEEGEEEEDFGVEIDWR